MIYSIFSKGLQETPQADAIVTSSGLHLSYQSVDCLIRRLATYLLQSGIKKDEIVAVLLQDEDQHVFIYLALDLISAVYLPLDTDTPVWEVQNNTLAAHFIMDKVVEE